MPHQLRNILCFLTLGLLLSLAPNLHSIDTYDTNNELPSSSLVVAIEKDPVAIDLINEQESIQQGQPFWIGIHLKIEENWHIYWKNPGDAGMAPSVAWNLPEGFKVDSLLWPEPKRFKLDTATGFGYENEVVLLAKISPPATTTQDSAAIGADVRWVVCSDTTCQPGESQISLKLPFNNQQPAQNTAQIKTFKQAREHLPVKNDNITAQRKEGLIELAFYPHSEAGIPESADFFPENQTAIDHSSTIQLQKGESPGQYMVVLKENEAASSLKGILVLNNATSHAAYEVDVPLATSPDNEEVSMADSIGSQEKLPAVYAPVPDNSFDFQGGLALALVFAFIGGMILNLMPCVLPVISFKILGFVKHAGESRKLVLQHGLAFAGGVLLSFWVLASLLLILQAYGRSVGWGFQLQEPLFVAVLAALIFIFGLSLFGLFEIGTSLIAAAGQVQHSSTRNALIGSFLSGILATAVATPCTGPFLGSAVGFAVTLPAPQAMLIFTFLGLGMSLPYLALAAFPSLLRFMPKPGPWMIVFKEIMGFLMLATVIWLVWVFSAQTNGFAVALLLAGFFLLAVACWIYGRWATPLKKKMTRNIGIFLALLFISGGGYVITLASSSWAETMGGSSIQKTIDSNIAGVWEEFSPERVAELRKQGIPVFIDFTAKWCLICQANHLVLTGDEVSQKFTDLNVVRMKADWTKRDEVIATELRKFGRNSVPLYVLYGSDAEAQPEILPQVLTPEIVMNSLKKLEIESP